MSEPVQYKAITLYAIVTPNGTIAVKTISQNSRKAWHAFEYSKRIPTRDAARAAGYRCVTLAVAPTPEREEREG